MKVFNQMYESYLRKLEDLKNPKTIAASCRDPRYEALQEIDLLRGALFYMLSSDIINRDEFDILCKKPWGPYGEFIDYLEKNEVAG